MGRPRPADFVRLAQQFSARQPDAFRADQPPAKKRSSPSGGDAFSPLLGRVNPPTLAGRPQRVVSGPVWPTALRARPRQQSGHRPARSMRPSRPPRDQHHARPRSRTYRSRARRRPCSCDCGAMRRALPYVSLPCSPSPPPAVSAARALFTATDLAATVVSLDARPRQLRDRPHHRFCRWRVADPNRY